MVVRFSIRFTCSLKRVPKAMWVSSSPTVMVPSAGRNAYCSSGISSAILTVLLRTVRKDAAISFGP
jgi:hypothetical protein